MALGKQKANGEGHRGVFPDARLLSAAISRLENATICASDGSFSLRKLDTGGLGMLALE